MRADTVAEALGASEAELLRRYFAKNHAYRSRALPLPAPRALVTWFTIDVLRSQAEHDGWGCLPGLLYGPKVEVHGALGDGAVAAAGYRQLLADPDGYELGVINCVTFFDQHQFAAGGNFHWEWVREAEPKRVLWYHLLTSEPGRHDQPPYLAGIYLSGETPTLALYCGTQHSGVTAAPTLYPDLAAGCTFGEAFRNAAVYEARHWGEPYAEYVSWAKTPNCAEFWQWGQALPATVLHGDGTLRLPPWQGNGGLVRHRVRSV